MKIAVLGYFDYPSWKEALVSGARRLRHEVVCIGPYDDNPDSFVQNNRYFRLDVPLENKYTWSWDELSLMCEIEGYELGGFDLILVLETNMDIRGEKPDEMKNVPVVYCVTDSHRGCDIHIKNFYQMHADYLAYSKLYFRRIYEDLIGKDRVFWLPECTDPEIFRPLPVEEEYDIIWLGHSGMKPDGSVEDPVFGENAWRAVYIKYLEEESKKGEFSFKHYGFVRKREDYVRALNSGRIVLNVGGGVSPLQAQTTNRLFEAMSCGKMVLTAYFVDLPLMFEDGKELVSFKSYHHWRHPYTLLFDCEEMKRLIKYYIEHEDERKEIGRRARKCIEERYSGDRNIERILHAIQAGEDG